MKADKNVLSESDFKKGKVKKRKSKRYRLVKFDRERFFIVWGIGFGASLIGIFIIGKTKAASETTSDDIVFNTAQRIIHFFPDSTIDILAFVFGNLLLLFGVICIFVGLKLVVQYIAGKRLN